MEGGIITWTSEGGPWIGEFPGIRSGSGVSIIFTRLKRVGAGPQLHRHPYSETFLVQKGKVVFTLGKDTFDASGGQIVVVPPGIPHRFEGRSRLVEMIDIHASEQFVTEWM